MSIWRTIFFLLLTVCAFLAYQFGDFFWVKKTSSPANKSEYTSNHPGIYPLPKKDLQFFVKTKDFLESNLSSEEELDDYLRKINPKNDWLVSLNENQRKKLFQNPSTFGLRIVDTIPELNFIRFSITDANRALALLTKFIKSDSLGVNHSLRQPTLPKNQQNFESREFSDSFIEWMGGSMLRDGYGNGIKVALLDSGVDSLHPMLDGVSVWEKDFLDNSSDYEQPTDNAHGSAIASVIAANTHSYTGVAPGSEILSYRVIDQSGNTDSYTVASAIISAVQDGADVINLSLGGREESEILKQAVSYALEHGVPLVAAAGNDGIGLVNYPAAYDGVIGVSSVDSNGRVPNFTNFGNEVDLAAPGVGVLTAWESSGVANFTGTSISTAMVTGAITTELAKNPNLSPIEIENLLKSLCNDSEKPGFDTLSGHGVLSLSRLENKNNPDYADPALVGFYFEHLDTVNQGTIPFEVMVQNQGNTWVNDLMLEVNYQEIKKRFRMDHIAPGELRTEKLYIQGAELDDLFQIQAELELPASMKDFRIINNQRKSIFSF